MRNNAPLIPILLALTGVTFLIFGLWPGIDVAVTGYFHDASGFPIKQNPGIETLRNVFWNASIAAPIAALILLIISGLRRKPSLGLPARIWGFILLLFLLGPGLLVNGILKAHWGRARPTSVADFGGTADFTPFYQISDQCAHNCSFVSGEGAGTMAATITALVILFAARKRLSPALFRLGQTSAIAALIFVGWQRVASGGHFLSDVLLSWLFVALIAAILARFMLKSADVAPRS